MERIRQEFNLTDRQEDVAQFYDYSLRRLRDQVVAGRILGINHIPGCGFIFYQDGAYKMLGPIPDTVQRYVLPRGTVSVAHEICSGAVSGLLYQGQLVTRKHQHPEVELMAEPGCSGIIAELVPFQTKS
jgi:hypothetical protein